QMTLPKMDLPIGIVEWEVFVPDTYSVRGVGGNVIDRRVAGCEVQGGPIGERVIDMAETVTVSAEAPKAAPAPSPQKSADAQKQAEPSQNVINLQRRAAGVLPVRVDVPRAGVSHQFVRPLVVDEETMVSFRYKRR